MVALIWLVLAVLASPFKSKNRLEAENAVLRHQLVVLRRKPKGRARLTNNDRWFFVQMYRWFPPILKVVTIIEPETLVRCIGPAFAATGGGNRVHGGGAPQTPPNHPPPSGPRASRIFSGGRRAAPST